MYKPKYEVGKIYTDVKGNKLHVTRTDPKELYGQNVWYRDEGTMTHYACCEKDFDKLVDVKVEPKAKPESKPTVADKNRSRAVLAKAVSKEKALAEVAKEKEILAKASKKKVLPKKDDK